MGFSIAEYHIRNVIEDSIARMRDEPEVIEEIFAELTLGTAARRQGRKTIDEIKKFFMENDIPVRAAFSQNQVELPSVTVNLASSSEMPQYRAFQDHVDYAQRPKVAAKLSDMFAADSYDKETGVVTLAPTFQSDFLLPGQPIFSCKDGVAYFVTGLIIANEPDTLPKDLRPVSFRIVDKDGKKPKRPDLTQLFILSKIDTENRRLAAAMFEETFDIKVHAGSHTDQAIWTYYVVVYALMRNKGYFEQVGMHNQTFVASEFTRDNSKGPNNVWGRSIRYRCQVQHTWCEDVVAGEGDSEAVITELLTPGGKGPEGDPSYVVVYDSGGFRFGSVDEVKPLVLHEDQN